MKMLSERFELGSELGSGGMGTVYMGTDHETGKSVAIKQLKREIASAELIERFRREGEALRELDHPNIVKMLAAIEDNSNYYLVMEYVAGGDLTRLLQNGALPLETILNLAIDLADALTRAHRLNIIHRDLKPANVLIGEDGTLHLTDFGVAQIRDKERVTGTDAIVGTIHYLPPETLQGEGFDERGDIWAFGVMLFEMITGQQPFDADSVGEVLQNITFSPIPELEDFRSDIPIVLVDLVYRMLERDRQARITSVRHVGALLEDILEGRVTQTPHNTAFDVSESDFFTVKKQNLPVQTTPFVGREPELAELARLMTDPSIRLTTIIAPGGMGKTRLALEAAERQLFTFDDGVYFVELAPLTQPQQIIPAIGSALDYKFQQGENHAQQELLEFLRNKHVLLVMDNYEHLLSGAELVGEILSETNHAKILVTSRQRLVQTGEAILHLGGMDFPTWETPDDALEYAAVKLFMNSARRAKPNFDLTASNLDDVARICKLVEGMPLGIVLSGAWVEMLSPEEIVQELEQSLDILADEVGELPARQQSIRVVMGYAWDMMTAAEQTVFMRLSVFKGGFTRDAAQTVVGANLRTLMSLVTKSLLRRDADSGRYEIHELLRQYAYEKLEQSGAIDATYQQHAAYFSHFLAEQLPLLKGGGQLKALADIDRDHENCHAAWVWSVEHNQPELIDTMIDSWDLYLRFSFQLETGYQLFEMARQQWSAKKPEFERVMARLNVRFVGTDERDVVQPLLEHGITIAQKHNLLGEVAFCKRELGRLFAHNTIIHDQAVIDRGIAYLFESLELCRQIGERYWEAWLLDDIGYAHNRKANFDLHIEYAGKSIELRQQVGDFIGYGDCLNGYTFGIFSKGATEEALRLLEQARALAYETGNSYLLSMITPTFAWVYSMTGEFEKALEAFQTGYRLSLAAKNERWRLTGLLGIAQMLCLLNRDMDLVEQYMSEVPPRDSLIYQDSLVMSNWMYAMTTYNAKKGNDAALYEVLQIFVRTWGPLGPLVQFAGFVPLCAYWLGRNRDPEMAVQWLGFIEVYQQTHKPFYFYTEWGVILAFQEAMRTKLGADKFDALWEAGKLLDAHTVHQQIMVAYNGG